MFGIKGRDTFNRPISTRAQIMLMIKKKWVRYFPFFLIFLIFSVIIFIAYVWYVYVYTKELTPEEETIYINEKKQEVIFRQKKFDELKDDILLRKERFDAQRQEYNDIFYQTKTNTIE